jgi:hypothetical protein
VSTLSDIRPFSSPSESAFPRKAVFNGTYTHTPGAFALLSFVIVHLYMIATGHTPPAHTRAMIPGREQASEGETVEDWERKAPQH